LFVIRAKLTSIKPDRSSSIDEYASWSIYPDGQNRACPPSENYPSCYCVAGRRGCADRANQFDPFAPTISLIRSSKAPNRLRLKANFVSEFKLMWVVYRGPKIFVSENRKLWYLVAIPFR
jgi:hypothetical protein